MKKSIIPVAAFIAGMAIVPSVFADDVDNVKTLKDWSEIASKCLNVEEGTTCSASDTTSLTAKSTHAVVTGTKVLDLAEKTLTIDGEVNGAAITVNGGTLTIKNGKIESNAAGDAAIVVENGGRLIFEDVDVKAGLPLLVNGATNKTTSFAMDAASTIEGTAQNPAVEVKSVANDGKTTIAINGSLKGGKAEAFKGTGNYEATFTNVVSSDAKDAIIAVSGTIILNGATVSAPYANGVVAYAGTVDVKNCATISASNAPIYVAGNMDKIAIENSTLKSANGSVFNSNADVEVAEVSIYGSYLKAANSTTKVKGGDIDFKAYDYDGKEHADVQLSQTTGSYGNANVVCDATAAEDEGEEDNKDDGTTNPNTADTIATYMTIAAVALLGLGATAFVAKKSNR